MSGYFSESFIIEKINNSSKRMASASGYFSECAVCGKTSCEASASLSTISELYY